MPRISRAQALDVLSTLSNVAGYRAVIEAAEEFGGMFTGQVTAAGKTPPANVFVIGAGVAGLAALGTASSLGAQVRAFDVRPEVGEQIESMGATFVQAEGASQEVSTDGYARELTAEQERLTAQMYAEQTAWANVVVTTALVRGQAPRTITKEMVAAMRPGSVIVDLAAVRRRQLRAHGPRRARRVATTAWSCSGTPTCPAACRSTRRSSSAPTSCTCWPCSRRARTASSCSTSTTRCSAA